jgi:hypothetical protein
MLLVLAHEADIVIPSIPDAPVAWIGICVAVVVTSSLLAWLFWRTQRAKRDQT